MDDCHTKIQSLYIRTCRDSGWQMQPFEAAKFVARLLNISPLEVWMAFGSLGVMEKVARGEHPACGVVVSIKNPPSA